MTQRSEQRETIHSHPPVGYGSLDRRYPTDGSVIQRFIQSALWVGFLFILSFHYFFFSSLLPVEAHLPFRLKRVLLWFKMQVMHFLKYTSMHSGPKKKKKKEMNNKKSPISAHIQSASK